MLGFDATFEPEIALFAPPQPVREVVSTPSTAWRGSSPPNERGPHWPSIIIPLNGIKTEEASVIRQVSPRTRGPRLSFLPGRKKEPEQLNEATEHTNGGTETASTHRRSTSKETTRQSFFRSPSIDANRSDTSGERRGSSATGRESLDKVSIDERTPEKDSNVIKMGSVRKRLSLLKLGMKSGKSAGVMGSVDEE